MDRKSKYGAGRGAALSDGTRYVASEFLETLWVRETVKERHVARINNRLESRWKVDA